MHFFIMTEISLIFAHLSFFSRANIGDIDNVLLTINYSISFSVIRSNSNVAHLGKVITVISLVRFF